EATKPNLWAPLAAVSSEHSQGFPLRVSRRSERDRILLLSGPFLLCLSVTCAGTIQGQLAMDPAVRLIGNLGQHKQIVSAKRPRRLPVAVLVPIRPRECNGVPRPLVRLLAPDSGLQTTVPNRLSRTLFRSVLRCSPTARAILRTHD